MALSVYEFDCSSGIFRPSLIEVSFEHAVQVAKCTNHMMCQKEHHNIDTRGTFKLIDQKRTDNATANK